MIVKHVHDMQALVLNKEWKNALILSTCFEGMTISDCSVWTSESNVGFIINILLYSWLEKMFKQRTCIWHNSFKVFLEVRSTFAEEEYTYEKNNFSWDKSCNVIRIAWDWKYLVYRSRGIWGGRKHNLTNSSIFMKWVRVNLQEKCVQFPSPTRFRVLA